MLSTFLYAQTILFIRYRRSSAFVEQNVDNDVVKNRRLENSIKHTQRKMEIYNRRARDIHERRDGKLFWRESSLYLIYFKIVQRSAVVVCLSRERERERKSARPPDKENTL